MTDSMTVEGWMQKSNFNEVGKYPIQAKVHADAAHHHTHLFMDTEINGYSQWFAGKFNNIADALSQDWHQLNEELTSILPLPTTDANTFQDISAAQRDQLLADFDTELITREQAATAGTHDNESHAWARWEEYCLSIRCRDIDMYSLSKQEQILLLKAFAMPVRSGRFSDSRFNTLAEGTVRNTISNVVQTFQATGRQNPTKDADIELRILLSRQFRAFRNEESKEKQQKALPFAVLDELTIRQVRLPKVTN